MSTLGEKLKKERNKRKWTLEETAKKLGLKGHSTYANWEYDRREPDLDMIYKLCTLYEVTIEYLTGRGEDSKPHKTIENYQNDPNLVDPFLIFELIDNKTDEEIINEFKHQAEGKGINTDTIKAHLKYIRFLRHQQK